MQNSPLLLSYRLDAEAAGGAAGFLLGHDARRRAEISSGRGKSASTYYMYVCVCIRMYVYVCNVYTFPVSIFHKGHERAAESRRNLG